MELNSLIPTLVTVIGLGLMFYYFRNRISITEQKVNLMFQLIQEHEKQTTIRAVQQNNSTINTTAENVSKNVDTNLINVSDDETESDYEDSEEVSDDDSERLQYGETLEGDEKIIKLNLAGSETTNIQEISPNDLTDNVLDTDNKVEMMYENENNNLDDEQDDEQDDDLDKISLSDEKNTPENSEHTENGLDYKKATVSQLKEICASKNLSGYSTMRKPALIELLEKN